MLIIIKHTKDVHLTMCTYDPSRYRFNLTKRRGEFRGIRDLRVRIKGRVLELGRPGGSVRG